MHLIIPAYHNSREDRKPWMANWGSPFNVIIPHMKILSCDWLTMVGHSIMSTGKMSTGKTSTVLTGSTGCHCCFHWYFTKLGFVRYNKTNMPCQCGYPDGMSPPSGKPSSLWETFHQGTHTGMPYLYTVEWRQCGTSLTRQWWRPLPQQWDVTHAHASNHSKSCYMTFLGLSLSRMPPSYCGE